MVVKHQLTVEEFSNLPEVPGMRYELVQGEAVAVPFATAIHNYIVNIIYRALFAFVDAHQLGEVSSDGVGYVLSRDPDTVRGPDVSFIAEKRIPDDGIPNTAWPIAPDLAVEVVSTNDRASAINDKVQQYLEAGVRIVWVVWPQNRTVMVHTLDEAPRTCTEADALDGMDLLPGFSLPIAPLFVERRKRR